MPTKVFYSPSYAAAGHSFDTTRMAQWVAESLIESPIAGLELIAPEPISVAQLSEVHAHAYIQAVQTGNPRWLAQSQGFSWDPGCWPMVLASNGGAVQSALAALSDGVSGSLSSGLHHARRDRGSAFCTFNGLALTAKSAPQSKVLIIDLDAHCGGGTYSLIAGDPRIWQLDVSVCTTDFYEPVEGGTLDIVEDASDYLPTIEHRLRELEKRPTKFDLCLYNAGVDPHEDCDIGGLEGITFDVLAERERIVFAWCRQQKIPVSFVLAGGYKGRDLSQGKLVDLHRLVLQEAAVP